MEYSNINTNITKKNHDKLMKLIKKNDKLLSMKLGKASVMDIALSHLFNDLETTNNTLEDYAVEHLKIIKGDNL